MARIISVKDFTRNTAKITDHIPGRKTHSYNRILRQLEKYHNSSDRGNWKEFLLLRELHRVTLSYLFYKQTSRSETIEMLAHDTEMRLNALIANAPMISWRQFDAATIRAGRVDSNNEYDYQVIIQLENDDIVHRAVRKLAAKNPEKTLIVQYDVTRDIYQLVYGDVKQLSGNNNGNNARWIFTGHGTTRNGRFNQHMSRLTPAALYIAAKNLRKNMALEPPRRIVLLGCRLGNNVAQQGFHENFAQQFINEMYQDDKNTTTSVRAYSLPVMVNDEGHRITSTYLTEESFMEWQQESKHRVDLRWNHGLLQTNNIPVILLVINDIYLKKLSVDQAIHRHRDILAYCFKNKDGVIDRVLLDQVVDNMAARETFIAHVIKSNLDPARWQGIGQLLKALEEARISLPGSSRTEHVLQHIVPPLSSHPLNQWEHRIHLEEATSGYTESLFPYDYQVIIQLEDNQITHKVVEGLVAAHPEKTLVIQYDIKTASSRRIYGNPGMLTSDNTRWFLVGHSRDSQQGSPPTFAGSTPTALSSALKELRFAQSLKPPASIVLAAHSSDNFGMGLISLMHSDFPDMSVRAYRATTTLNIAGRTVTIGDSVEGNSFWLAKNNNLRVEYKRKPDGMVTVNGAPAIFLIVDDIYSGILPINRAITEYSDILKYFFTTADGRLNQQLLMETVNNSQKFEQFINYIDTLMTNPPAGEKTCSFSCWLETSSLKIPPKTLPQTPAPDRSGNESELSDQQSIRLQPLKKRAHKTRAIMNNLATGRVKLTELNQYEYRYLSDFFQGPDSTLDIRRLMLTLTNEQAQQTFYRDLYELLQLGDNHQQLQSFTGQEALQYSKTLNNRLSENILNLQKAVDKNRISEVISQTRIALNTLYIHDGSYRTKRNIANIGLAWLHALSLGEPARERFINGMNTYTEINELKASELLSALEVQQSHLFHKLISNLSSKNYMEQHFFTAMGQYSLDSWLSGLADNDKDGYFQLVADNLVLSLARRIVNRQQNWYLYNPDVGEIQITGRDPHQVMQVLKTTLDDYLNSHSHAWNNQTLANYYGVQKQAGKLSFHIYQMNTANFAPVSILNNLQQLLDNGFSTERQRIKGSGSIKLGNVTLPWQTLYEMGATIDGQRISAALNFSDVNLQNRLCFDPRMLTQYFAQTSQQEAVLAIRLLKQRITEIGSVDGRILVPHESSLSTEAAIQLLDKIASHVDVDNKQINNQWWLSLNLSAHKNHGQAVSKIMQGASWINQAYSYYQALTVLADYWRRTNQQNITPQETQELTLELSLTLGHLGVDFSEYSLKVLGNRLTSKAFSYPLPANPIPGSRLKRLRFATGIKLSKFSGPILSFASSGFDIYDAYRYFSHLESTSSPLLRQDLIVQGSLSVLSAAVGIGTSIAIMAGGTAMKIAGPFGVLAGSGIIISSRIYTAARQLADIKKYVTLSTGELWRNGLLLFAGKHIESDIHNRLAAARTREEARTRYDQILQEQGNNLLADLLVNKGIDTYYYSKGDFYLEEQTYLQLTGKEVTEKRSNILGNRQLSYSGRKILADFILPQQQTAVLLRHQQALFSQKPRYTELSIEDSEYHFYTPTTLKAVNDEVNVNANFFSKSVTKTVSQPPKMKQPPNTNVEKTKEPQENAALFDLHQGNDTAVGHWDKKNVFIVQAGHKNFTGGQRADSFLLMGQPAPESTSELDGGHTQWLTTSAAAPAVQVTPTAPLADHDIVIAASQPVGGGGYSIDLEKGKVNYIYGVNDQKTNSLVANLQRIEHAQGHAQTNDILTGNDDNNSLNGAGGLDKIYGNGGDDVLTLADGYADGGSGIDTYCILQNSQQHHVSITIQDAFSQTEINNIRLSYSVEQIKSIELLPSDDVMLTLINDNNTETHLKLINIYQSSDSGALINLSSNYILYTNDGILLFPEWPQKLAKDKTGKWLFSPMLTGQYSPLLDNHWQQKFGEKKPEEIRIHLQRQDSKSQGSITIGDQQTRLPSFIKLATEGTQFNDLLEGDNSNNWLRSYQGNDTLIGKGGTDIYEIHAGTDSNFEVTIDNFDNYRSVLKEGQLQQELDTDFLLLKQSVHKMILTKDKNDILLWIFDPEGRYSPKIRIRNFMSDERNRHLMMIDKNGQSYELDLNEIQQPWLRDQHVQASPTGDDDHIVVSGLTTHSLDALAGDDIIVDQTGHGRTLHGGENNDIILVTEGNNSLHGDSGDDWLYGGSESDVIEGGSGNDTFSGSQGNDILQDSQGDDIYLFSQGDGQDIIRDLCGTDRLRFLNDEIDKNSLWFKRQENNLAVLVSSENSGDKITLEGYFTKLPSNADNIIEIANYQLRGKDIALLTEVMSDFPVFEYSNPFTGIPNAVQKSINELWLEVPVQ